MRPNIFAASVIVFSTMTLSAADATLPQLNQMSARFATVPTPVDTSKLSAGDKAALQKLVAAGRLINHLFLQQMWSGNIPLYDKLRQDQSPAGKAKFDYFWLNKGPWSELDNHKAFLAGVPDKRPDGANFYPENMTKGQFEDWAKTLSSADKEKAEGFFTVIRRGPDGKLKMVPFSEEYRKDLEACAKDLRDAAKLTDNATLKRFLETRAAAFTSNDYYESDMAWMDLDAPLDITIGPYETYNDEIFGYKASFEAYINVRDEVETAKLKFYGDHMQEVENSLPIDQQYRNPKLGALSPIRVVNQVFAAGDGDHGVKTAAYNLPNDERVVHEKGSKRVMLRNVQEVKFKTTLTPISSTVLDPAALKSLDFDSFFSHILAHEMSHGIGPHQIKANGRDTTPRQELKEVYSAVEEAKADVLGLYMLQHFFDKGYIKNDEEKLYTTFLASSFRTLRFGLNEAHGKGMALQVNYLTDKGAFVYSNGKWHVDQTKIKGAVRDLAHDLLMVEATGDYKGAKRMLDTLSVLRPDVTATLNRVGDVPVDIKAVFTTADQLDPTSK
jgi:Peptidase family M49